MNNKNWLYVVAFFIFNTTALAIKPDILAPNIYGRHINNQLFRLSDIRSEIIVVNFFWINCKPCEQELPELSRLEAEYPGIEFVVIHVEDEGKLAIQNFLKKLSSHPNQIIVASPMVKKTYGIKGFPYTILINKGKIDSEYIGYSETSFNRLKLRLQLLSQLSS